MYVKITTANVAYFVKAAAKTDKADLFYKYVMEEILGDALELMLQYFN